jgi:hypothetical protein
VGRSGRYKEYENVGGVHNEETGFKPSLLSYAEIKPVLVNFEVLMLLYLAVSCKVSEGK